MFKQICQQTPLMYSTLCTCNTVTHAIQTLQFLNFTHAIEFSFHKLTSLLMYTVRRYHVHVRFVHPITSTRCYDPLTIDQSGLLSQMGGLTVTLGWNKCYWVRNGTGTELNARPPDQKASALALAPLMRVSWIPSWRRQSKWLGRMPPHWSMLPNSTKPAWRKACLLGMPVD